MITTQNMNKICKICSRQFEVTDADITILKKINEPNPQPTCFEDSQKLRLCFRNDRALYRRECDATGEIIISIYSEDKPYKVYKSDYWYSDNWDAITYGQDIDWNRSFFDQLHELQLKVPRLALSNVKGVNSEYCNMTFGNKNCYLIFGGDFNEDCAYGTLSMYNKNCFESDYSNHCELCYEISDCLECYNVNFAFDSKSCHDCSFISDCIGCNNCILCANLINQTYCINNKKLSKEDFETEKVKILAQKIDETFQEFLEIRSQRIVKYAHLVNCENSTGDYLKNCKNCINCFDTAGSEDMRDIIFANNCKDCFNCGLLGDNSSLCYDLQSTLNAYNSKHSYFTIDSTDIEYSDIAINSEHLFGCVGLRHKKYCILNKQYEKEEYFILKQKLIEKMIKDGEYGLFLPQKMSCFGYNETTAFSYYPLTEEEALTQGYKWK